MSRGSAIQRSVCSAIRSRNASYSRAFCAFAEVAGIWMGQELDEAARVAETLDLAEPELDIAVPEQREQGVVLRERPGQLHRVADEVRPWRAAAARLWLIRVAQWHRAVVLEGQLSKPIGYSVGRRRPEPDGAEGRPPLRGGAPAATRTRPASRTENDRARRRVRRSRIREPASSRRMPWSISYQRLHDIERRAKAACGLDVGDPQCVPEAGRGLDVVGERESGPALHRGQNQRNRISSPGRGERSRPVWRADRVRIRRMATSGNPVTPWRLMSARRSASCKPAGNSAADAIERRQRPGRKRR